MLTIDPIIEALTTGVAVVGPDARLTLANSAFAAYFGSQDVVGLGLDTLASHPALGCQTQDQQRFQLFLTTTEIGQTKVVTTLASGKTVEWQRQPIEFDMPLAGFVLTAYDITAIEKRIALLTLASEVDGLTGMANRRKFDEAFHKTLDQSLRTGQQGALLLFDLDRFKTVNDRFGHAHGDAVLRQVSQAVAPLIRHYELIARVGGDEFGILISHDGPRAVARLLTQLPLALSAINQAAHGAGEPLEISMGYSFFPDQEHSVKPIFDTADRLLYVQKALKRGGRDL